MTCIDNGQGHISNQSILLPALSRVLRVLNPNNRQNPAKQKLSAHFADVAKVEQLLEIVAAFPDVKMVKWCQNSLSPSRHLRVMEYLWFDSAIQYGLGCRK
jgi:hypothetical protein